MRTAITRRLAVRSRGGRVARAPYVFPSQKVHVGKFILALYHRTGFMRGMSEMARSIVGVSNNIFKEFTIARLHSAWLEQASMPVPIFKRYSNQPVFKVFTAKVNHKVQLEFFNRGYSISPLGAAAFREVLSHRGRLGARQLYEVAEILHIMIIVHGDDFFSDYDQLIDHAEVGLVHGRPVLVVTWNDRKSKRTVSSIFIDALGDGETVHEMHFSAPKHLYASQFQLLVQTMRSLQWKTASVPPVISVA
jgi:hypothetical protein